MVSKFHRLLYFYLGMCCTYAIFFWQQYPFLLVSSFFASLSAEPDLMVSWTGRGEEGGSADAAINFTLMMISLSEKSEKLLWSVVKWMTKDSVKFGLQLNIQKEVAAAVGKAAFQLAEEREREKLSLQKWFSYWATKDRSSGNVKTSWNIRPLQNWALGCCFLPTLRRGCIVSVKGRGHVLYL